MNVNLDLTLIRLKEISQKYPVLTEKISIGLSEVEKSQEEHIEFSELSKKFNSMGIKTYIKKNWIHNRINGRINEQDKKNFIKGCGLFKNKPLRRIEVKVDGSVVLCDDDADGRKVFGNVFKDGIEKIWQGPLLKEHLLLYKKEYTENKKDLICKTCSRAQWNKRKGNAFNSLKELNSSFVLKESLKKNVHWI
jgi:radical SAM protein with 4Fe4S-binding SPASM domain